MKTRVIKYDKSGNKVVNAFLELEPVAENVFKAFYQPADYGGPSQDLFTIVFRINEVYFSIGNTSRMYLECDENCKRLAERCRTWIQDVMESVARHDYIRLLEIRVFEMLGMDTSPLWKSREIAENRRKEEDRLREKKRERKESGARRNMMKCLMSRKAGSLPVKRFSRNTSLNLRNVTDLRFI